jgi:hypothetical protein
VARTDGSPMTGSARLAALVGGGAVAFSAVYFLSDVIELAQDGFSTMQLALTYAAEAAIPIFVLGLFALQRPRIGTLGLVGAVTYGYTFVFFTSTVVYALVNHTDDWTELTAQFGAWLTVHSVLMILGGVMFGTAVIQAHVLPRWTGITLIVGMVLMAATSGLPDVTQTMSAGVRDLAFAGMGVALLRHPLRPAIGEGRTRPSELRRQDLQQEVVIAPGGQSHHEHRVATPTRAVPRP